MFERGISVKRVISVLRSGNTIEDYSSEMQEPSRLMLGFQGRHPLHVVISENQETNEVTVITVYTPNVDQWSKDFKRRRA
jgi:hypothetical protein